jgi:hypothetical protein
MPSTEDGECFEPGGTTRTSKGGKDDGREGKGPVRTIMLSVCFLTVASMKTSNSSRHRMGQPTVSQNARRRATVEKDFSPPESWLAFL